MITLPEQMTIHEVIELQAQWLTIVQQCSESGVNEIMIEAEHVKDMDAAGLQLLLSLQKTCQSNGQTLSIQQPSEVLMYWTRLIHVEHILCLKGADNHE